jgi:peptide chain release factor 2
LNPSGGIFDVPSLHERLQVLQKKLSVEDLWQSPEKAQELLKKKSDIENSLQPLHSIEKRLEDIHILLELSEEDEGEVFLEDARKDIEDLKSEIDEIELKCILSEELDKGNAIMTINSGAGGTESQDWAQILMRMYIRWAERSGFKVQVVDSLPGEEAGIKSVTITVSGRYVYGYLKGEAGVHRLVRISPFDANKRRHTSFAAVLLYPEVSEDVEVEIRDDDLKIDTFRASGAGGQHVNKTRSHLYAMKKKEQDEKMEEFIGEKKDIAWGSQIRSYTLQPYQLIKDHRTGVETGNVNAVLDGGIDEFIKGYLLMKKEKSKT